MGRGRSFLFFLSLACLPFTVGGFALPKDAQVVSGTSDFKQLGSHQMEIRPSDQAIINYLQFDIGAQEKVKFIQKSSSSCVLNRVRGETPSQIFGSLESNGKVFIVNPNGMYFGPNSYVNVGALIASTLDISDMDFLQENYQFLLSNKNAIIRNEGLLESLEGSIALVAPKIQNLGSIVARAGTVALASGEHVTLDFTGDGLIRFSVEGSLKDALIEHVGDITASTVALKMPVAKKVISEIVNLDGVEEGDVFIEENGVIKFASLASIESKKVLLEAVNLDVKGEIDASDFLEQGGEVCFVGRDILLEGAHIDASGRLGGGEVLIGGEYQGKGDTPWASKVIMDESSFIQASATESGDGGLVVLWSQDQTVFNGKISSQGGSLDGKGGLVETSSRGGLDIAGGQVDTFSSEGKLGKWLLDPDFVQIAYPGASTSCSLSGSTWGDCSSSGTCYIDASVFSNLTTDINVQGFCSVTINASFDVTTASGYPKASLTLENCGSGAKSCTISYHGATLSTSTGVASIINTKNKESSTISVTTDGGSFTCPDLWIYQPFSLNTNGGDITINNAYGVINRTGLTGMTLAAGSGTINLKTGDTYGVNNYVTSIVVNSAGKVLTSRLRARDGPLTITAPLYAADNTVLDTSATGVGYPITVSSIEGQSTSATVSFTPGGKSITINGNVGSTTPLQSFAVSSSVTSSLFLQDVTTAGGDINISASGTFSGTTLELDSQGGDISLSNMGFSSSITSLILDAGSGALTLPSLPSTLKTIDITSSDVTISGGMSATDSISITSSGVVTISGAVSVGTGDFTGSGSGSIVCDSITAGSDINLSVSVTSSSMNAGNDISFGGSSSVAGTISAGNILSSTATVSLSGNTTMIGTNGISMGGDINGAFDLTLDAPSNLISLQGVGVNTSLNSFTITSASSLEFSSIFTATGNIDISKPSSVIVVAGSSNPTLSSGSGQIVFGSALTANSSGTNLVIYSPAYSLSLPSIGSTNLPFDNMIITGPAITLSSELTLTGDVTINNSGTLTVGSGGISVDGAFFQTGAGPVSLAGNVSSGDDLYFKGDVTITKSLELTSSGGMDFDGTILPNATGFSLTLNSGSSSMTVAEIGSDTFPLSTISITGGVVNLGQTIKTTSLSINNSSILDITTKPISLSGSFQQIGTGATTLEQDITASSVAFTGDLSLEADNITIAATGGDLSFRGISESNSNVQTLNLVATGLMSASGDVITNILSVPSAPKGISIGGLAQFTDACTIVADTGDIVVGSDFEVTGSKGTATLTAIAGNISVGENVEVQGSSGVATFTANAGTVDIGNQLKVTNLTVSASDVTIGNGIAFVATGVITATGSIQVENDISSSGDFTMSANDATFGNMTTTGGNIFVDASVTIQGSSPDLSSSGGDITFTKSIIPEFTAADLRVDAITGNVTLNTLGSAEQPFDDITVVGCEVVVGDYYATGSFEVENCADLTLPQKVLSAGRDFIQSGVGPVSLAYNITAGQVLYFTGPVTITEDIMLTGLKGIDFEGPVFAGADDLSLTLNAPSSLVVLHDVGTHETPFESVSIVGDTVVFKGSIRSSILEFNGAPVTSSSSPSTEQLFNTVPKSNLFVPGLYSSWETFFDKEYFQVSPVNFSNE